MNFPIENSFMRIFGAASERPGKTSPVEKTRHGRLRVKMVYKKVDKNFGIFVKPLFPEKLR